MPTTTNYGWTTPADTDLVKDGAAAIRTLGSSIDTTVFNNANAAIAKTIVDAKGDIIAATAADTVARLAVGANDTVLTADSSTATGLKWASVAGGGMTLISTTTLSGASITLSSIPSTYVHLQLIIRDCLPANDGSSLQMRLNGDSNANRYAYYGWNNSHGVSTSFDADLIPTMLYSMDNSVTENFLVVDLFDYTNTSTWKFGNHYGLSVDNAITTKFYRSMRLFAYNQTAAISSLTLSLDSGDFTSGTVLLYGVK